jgi:Glycosyltransferase family 87
MTHKVHRWQWLLIAAMALYSMIALGRIISIALIPRPAIDFTYYWHDALYMRQGLERYSSDVKGIPPQLPITFIDGTVISTLPFTNDQQKLFSAANLPLGLYVFAPFAYLEMQKSYWIFTALNVLMAFSIPFLLFALLSESKRIGLGWLMIAALSFYVMLPVRNGIINGQQTIMAIFFMLLAMVLARRNRAVFAGVALAIALIKFSVSLPAFLLFVYKRQWKIAIISGVVHVLALILYTVQFRIPIIDTVQLIYQRLFQLGVNRTDDGISLGSYFPDGFKFWPPLILMTLLTAVVLLALYRPLEDLRRKNEGLADLHILGILICYITLGIYHQYYDVAAVIVTVIMAVICAVAEVWQQKRLSRYVLWIMAVCVAMLSTPGAVIERLVPGGLRPVYEFYISSIVSAATLILILFFFLHIWLARAPVAEVIDAEKVDS